ncbi:MAG: hypothetical protein OXH31_09550 [Gammaproteobacteria bacterium]|nr:hypothetical protein [Gammaproteobacteria bacterium]
MLIPIDSNKFEMAQLYSLADGAGVQECTQLGARGLNTDCA